MSKGVLAEPVQKQADSSKACERLQESPDSRQTADGRILGLQRAMGNRRVAELIDTGQITRDGRLLPIQPRLRVSAPDDADEQQAGHVARQVVSTPDAEGAVAPSERKNGNGSSASASAQVDSISRPEPEKDTKAELEAGEGSLQRQASGGGTTASTQMQSPRRSPSAHRRPRVRKPPRLRRRDRLLPV